MAPLALHGQALRHLLSAVTQGTVCTIAQVEVGSVTSLDAHQATPEDLAAFVRGQWGIENSSHHIRDVTFGEDSSTVHV